MTEEDVSRPEAVIYGTFLPLALMTLGLFLMLGWRRSARLLHGQCPQCGYDLRGQTEAGCPECGWRRSAPEH